MDEQLFFIINGCHNEFFDQVMYILTSKWIWIPLYVSLLYAVWRNYSWKGVLGILLMVAIGMLFTDCLNSQLLRPWIGRLRPSNPDNPIAPLVHIVNGRHGNGCGLPSAHSANMWMLTFVTLHWLRNKWLATNMAVLTTIICYSRIYLGFHYPGDILGGFILAAIVSIALHLAHKKLRQFSAKEQPTQTWVPICVTVLTICYTLIVASIQ